jgi:hypothetical protein
MRTRKSSCILGGLVALAAFGTTIPACAQNDNNSGPLPMPRPYGDRGTKSPLGNPPIRYQTKPNTTQNQLNYWQNRIISGPGYYDSNIIIIGGVPCYAPFYYGYGLNGYYDNSQYGFGIQSGGFQYGYGQIEGDRLNLDNYRDYINRQEPVRNHPQAPAQTTARGASADDSDYYLHKKPKPKTALDKDPLLAEAVKDIEFAFQTGDSARLEKHIVPTSMLTLQAKGRTRKPLAAAAYVEMTREAMADMKTIRYELNKIDPASNGAWMAYGTHVLRNEDGKEKTFSVAFVLKKSGDRYVITEVSADPT